jgi:phosphatidate cytidylyltransferase
MMAGLFILAIVANGALGVLFFTLVSFLELKEYFSIVLTRDSDKRIQFCAYLAMPLQYLKELPSDLNFLSVGKFTAYFD